MKKHSLIIALCLILFTAGKTISAPMYTDEIPQEYINQVRASKKHNEINNKIELNKETAIPVSVYSPQNVWLKISPVIKDLNYITFKVKNMSINDELTFVIAQDVYKNNKLIIKKDTPAIGLVKRIILNADNQNGAYSEFRVSDFTTKDINNNTVNLYGYVVNNYDKTMNLRHAISKNKMYTLYLK